MHLSKYVYVNVYTHTQAETGAACYLINGSQVRVDMDIDRYR